MKLRATCGKGAEWERPTIDGQGDSQERTLPAQQQRYISQIIGVFLRCCDIKSVLAALEIQCHETTDGSRIGMVGAICDALKPSKEMARPAGGRNHFAITCKGPKVSLVFNGEMVIGANLVGWKEARKNPDGSPNGCATALKDFARKGPIGLQGLPGKAQVPVCHRNLTIQVQE